MQIDNLDWHVGMGVLGSIAVVLFRMEFLYALCGVYGVKEMLDTIKELKSLL